MPSRSKFIETALSWEGEPHARIGYFRKYGVNCLGLIIGILNEVGGFEDVVEEYKTHAGKAMPMGKGSFLEGFKRHTNFIPFKDAIPGDILIYRIEGEPTHAAILVNKQGYVIHSSANRKKVTVEKFPKNWRPIKACRISRLTDD